MSSDRMLQRTVLQVIANPYLQSLIALPVLRRVGTVLGAGEGVVEATCLDNDLNGRIICPINISIEHSRTLRCLPFQSKKASHKVFSRLEHSILRLCLLVTYVQTGQFPQHTVVRAIILLFGL